MTDLAVEAVGLGKRYEIGRAERYATLRDAVSRAGSATLSRARRRLGVGGRIDADAGHIWALRDVCFEIRSGESFGVIGPNGAGKSTLLKLLSRITYPTTGSALVRGRVGSLLEVGTGFHLELTGRENIYLSAAILGMRRKDIDRRFASIVEFADVEKFIDTPVKHFSSGMYLRLAFAVAIHLEPDVLIVDEVLAVGDVQFQQRCLSKMNLAANEGRTVLIVSHNMAAISHLTQRCLYLDGGEIKGLGPTSTVIQEYMGRIRESDVYPDGWKRSFIGSERTVGERGGFTAVRTSVDGKHTSAILEGRPFSVSMLVELLTPVTGLQLGCGVGSLTGGWIFTAPSPHYTDGFAPGVYEFRVHIDPNFLRPGDYRLALKLFLDGRREDTVVDAYRFQIHPYLEHDDSDAYLHAWVAGPVRADVEWSFVGGRETAPD